MTISRRTLRSMRDRWQRDLDRLEKDAPVVDYEGSDANIETQRNLATAIAEIGGMITARRPPKRITP